MAVVNCRNMKLFLKKGSCVLTDSKQYVFKHCTNTAFNVLNILMGTGYIQEWWPHIITIIDTFLILHLPECIQPKQSLAPPPPNTLHSPQLLWTTQILCCCQEPASPFLITADSHNIVQLPMWFLSKASNIFITSHQQPAICASCRQYCFVEDHNNYQVNPPQLNIMCFIKHIWLLCSKTDYTDTPIFRDRTPCR
jgi:hypothetical protein